MKICCLTPQVLLRGCRCVEIDCWNGGPDSEVDPKSVQKENEKNSVVEPVVLHGMNSMVRYDWF
jgi:hypothetical protein